MKALALARAIDTHRDEVKLARADMLLGNGVAVDRGRAIAKPRRKIARAADARPLPIRFVGAADLVDRQGQIAPLPVGGHPYPTPKPAQIQLQKI